MIQDLLTCTKLVSSFSTDLLLFHYYCARVMSIPWGVCQCSYLPLSSVNLSRLPSGQAGSPRGDSAWKVLAHGRPHFSAPRIGWKVKVEGQTFTRCRFRSRSSLLVRTLHSVLPTVQRNDGNFSTRTASRLRSFRAPPVARGVFCLPKSVLTSSVRWLISV
jgi:hypothetical protein